MHTCCVCPCLQGLSELPSSVLPDIVKIVVALTLRPMHLRPTCVQLRSHGVVAMTETAEAAYSALYMINRFGYMFNVSAAENPIVSQEF